MHATAPNGILQRTTARSVDETLGRLLSLLRAKSITVFAVVDHSGEARKAGLAMPDTQLVIFGSPRAGTPLMLAAPGSALDLPLKILLAQAEDASTRISYNSLDYLEAHHGLSPGLVGHIAGIEQIVDALLSESQSAPTFTGEPNDSKGSRRAEAL